jgi:hypothetical protein
VRPGVEAFAITAMAQPADVDLPDLPCIGVRGPLTILLCRIARRPTVVI